MIAARHPNATRYLGAPAGWVPDEQGTCGHLAVADIPTSAGPGMDSIWEPTPAELRALNRGGFVRLTILGSMHPPVCVSVLGVAEGD